VTRDLNPQRGLVTRDLRPRVPFDAAVLEGGLEWWDVGGDLDRGLLLDDSEDRGLCLRHSPTPDPPHWIHVYLESKKAQATVKNVVGTLLSVSLRTLLSVSLRTLLSVSLRTLLSVSFCHPTLLSSCQSATLLALECLCGSEQRLQGTKARKTSNKAQQPTSNQSSIKCAPHTPSCLLHAHQHGNEG